MPTNQINVEKRPKEPGIIPNFSTILLFDLIYLCKKLRLEKAVYVCRFAHGGDTFPLGTTSLLQGSFGLQEAYTKACPNSAKKIPAACWCHVMTPCQVLMIFRRVLGLQEFKNQVSQSFRPSHDAQMFEFHSHLFHGT